jgi:hypothetical protein
MRRPGLLLLLAALACGTTSGRRTGQSVEPAADTIESVEMPMLACVDAMLVTSKLIKSVTLVRSTGRSREYGLGLRSGVGLGFSAHAPRDGKNYFAAEFTWPGPWMGATGGGMTAPRDPHVYDGQGEMVRDNAVGLLREVASECAPNTPGEPGCMRLDQGRRGRCALGGE